MPYLKMYTGCKNIYFHASIVTILLASLSARCAISTINTYLYFHAPGFTLITYIEVLIGKSVSKMCLECKKCYVVIYMFIYIPYNRN